MGKKWIIVVLTCLFALSLSLVGCGGGSGSAASEDPAVTAKKAFVGTWDMVEMNQGDSVTGSEDVETLKALGLEVYLNLNEDNTAAFVVFGEVFEGSWEASSPTSATLDLGTTQDELTIVDSKLKFERSGSSITFEKGEAKEVPVSEAAPASEATSASEASPEPANSAEEAPSSSESAKSDSASAVS